MKRTNLFRIATPILALSLLAATGCDSEDDDPNPNPDPDPSTAAIRVIHGSPDAPAVDIYAAGVSTPLITNLGYGDTSRYLEVDAGTYDIEIRPAGAPASAAPVFTTGPLALGDGDRVTALAAGLLAGDGDQAFRVIPLAEDFAAPADGNAIVRIVHGSADAPTVAIDVGNDGTPEVAALDRYADIGAAGVELPAGTAIQVGIWAGDPLARVTAFTTPELPAGAELFVIATGLLGEKPRDADGFSLLAVGPEGSVGFVKQNPVVYAMHGSPDAPAVDIYAGNAALVENLAFGGLSGAIQVPPASYTLDFYAAGTGPGTPVVSVDTPSLAAGERYLAIASGFLTGSGDDAFQLIYIADELDDEDPNNTRLGVVHASPDAPAVDIGTASGGEMDTVLVGDLAFPNAVAGAGLSVPPAELTIGVAAAGNAPTVAEFDIATAAGLRVLAVAAGALSPADGEEAFRLFLVVTSGAAWQIVEIQPN